jgi:hypothetical protein
VGGVAAAMRLPFGSQTVTHDGGAEVLVMGLFGGAVLYGAVLYESGAAPGQLAGRVAGIG